MFEKFVKPELEASCNKLGRAIYHLDGRGQIIHLGSLLRIKKLDCVQWIPGEGSPDQTKWPEIYREIHSAGKKIQTTYGFDALDAVIEQTGAPGIIQQQTFYASITEEREVRKHLEKYQIV